MVWEMKVPVLSTAHLPGPKSIEELRPLCKVVDMDYGWLLRVDHDEPYDKAPWFTPIVKWFRDDYGGGAWIRFDQDGDEIDDLPTYDW